jgi:hypothetical protein
MSTIKRRWELAAGVGAAIWIVGMACVYAGPLQAGLLLVQVGFVGFFFCLAASEEVSR